MRAMIVGLYRPLDLATTPSCYLQAPTIFIPPKVNGSLRCRHYCILSRTKQLLLFWTAVLSMTFSAKREERSLRACGVMLFSDLFKPCVEDRSLLHGVWPNFCVV